MFKLTRVFALAIIAFVAVTQAAMAWEVSYKAPLPNAETKGWKVTGVFVEVPRTLSVSEENRLAPDADIVWRGAI